ncbi:MAG: hypothetical protein KKB51_22750 [Candidatus Riflebacteria bacterium]|nr:hypothetical protein [Candidatus Riflebacteria bacterium]
MRRIALFFIAAMLLMQPASVIAQRTVELDVYSEWRGDNCMYKSERPFFIIRDLYDLEKFWQKANADEATPAIDFTKCMLLVWAPGSSLFDHQPVAVERFVYQNGFYIVVMDFKRKDTGGYWRRPFVATLLPNKAGDIFIMRKVVRGSRVDWKPVYTIWDMTGERTRPLETVKIETPPAPEKYVDHGRQTSTTKPVKTGSAPTTAQSGAAAISEASSQQTVAAARPSTTPTSAAVAAGRPVANPASIEEDLFGTAPVTKTETKAQPAAKTGQPSFPTFEEDPLFGTEFDIEF